MGHQLSYGQIVRGTFLPADSSWYEFAASRGDVVSLILSPMPRPAVDPEGYSQMLAGLADPADAALQIELYDATGNERLAEGGLLHSIGGEPKARNIVHAVEADATYRVKVWEGGGRDVRYQLQLNRIGGPNLWYTGPHTSSSHAHSKMRFIERRISGLKAPVPGSEALTSQNVDGPALHDIEIFFALRRLVAEARYEVGIRSGNISSSDPLEQVVEGAKEIELRIRTELERGEHPHYPVLIRIIPDLLAPPYCVSFLVTRKKKGKAMEILDRFKDVDPRFIQVEVAIHFHRWRGEDHSKIVHVDGRYVHIGGANLSKNNNFHHNERDSGYLYFGEVAQRALAAFDHAWRDGTSYLAVRHIGEDGKRHVDKHKFRRGRIERRKAYNHHEEVTHPDWQEAGLPAPARLTVFFLDKHQQRGVVPGLWSDSIANPIAQGLLAAIETAETEVNMTSPNFNDEPIIDAVVYAIIRGVNVRILLPYRRNAFKVRLPFGGGTNETALERLRERVELARRKVASGRKDELSKLIDARVEIERVKDATEWGQLEVRWWEYNGKKIADGPGAYHIKLMTVDQVLAFNGSTNWDGQSLNKARETSLIVINPRYARHINETVFLPEWEQHGRERQL